MSAPAKVLFIGIDAADKDLLLQWSAAGVLPTFRRLLQTSAWAPTINPPGLFEGAVWPSIYTGLSPAHHGRYCYEQLRPGTYEVARFRASQIKGDPFWRVLSRAGRRVAVIDVPKTVVAPKLNGIQVVDWATHDPEFPSLRTWPPSLARSLRARFGPAPVASCDAHRTTAAEYATLRETLLQQTQRKADLSEHFLRQGGWDLFLTVFSEPHCAGHHFWHLHDPSHPRYDRHMTDTLGDPLRDVYIEVDHALGRLLAQAGGDATAFVLASHGMGPHYHANFMLDTILSRLEGVAPPPPGAPPRLTALLSAGWRRLPTALRARLARARRYALWRLDTGAHAIDGTRTCFAVPNNDGFGAIRINLAGREPRGRVQPGPEYDALCAALTDDLLALVNVESGEAAVADVIRTADVYAGPCMSDLPDLLVQWNRAAPFSRLESRKVRRVEGTYAGSRSGDHRPEGLFCVCGPGVRPGPLPHPVSSLDIAPTVAARLGVALPGVEGRPVAAFSVSVPVSVAAL